MSELEQLRLGRIPEGRRLLREQHGNLLRVAEYCHGHYLQVRGVGQPPGGPPARDCVPWGAPEGRLCAMGDPKGRLCPMG